MIIYKATFPNKKAYIGQTKNGLNIRRNLHRLNYKKGLKTSIFYNAIKKYGFDDIKWEVITECDTWEEMQQSEIDMIKKYRTIHPGGYNTVEGGRQPKNPKTIFVKGHKINLGRKQTKEHRENIGKANRHRKNNTENMRKARMKEVDMILDGKIIKKYNSSLEASRDTKILKSCISNAINGRAKTAGGFVWRLTKK